MSHFQGVTLAFSHKDRVWKTRYSFTPTSYGYVDNVMLSTNGRHPSSNQTTPQLSNCFWLHDSNENRNNFYGFQYRMELAFVANYNPSSVKLFKSISAESNSNAWKGFVTTNNNPFNGEDNKEYQVSDLPQFKRKEGVSYADILFSKSNSTTNIISAFTSLNDIGSTIDVAAPVFADSYLEWEIDIDRQHGQIPTGASCFLIVPTQNGLSYIKGNSLVPVESNTPSITEGFAFVDFFSPASRYVTIKMLVRQSDLENYPFNWITGSGPDQVVSNMVCIETPALTNGDSMRGQYMNVYLHNDSIKPVECLAFNLNYEPTKLDHSLGQNA